MSGSKRLRFEQWSSRGGVGFGALFLFLLFLALLLMCGMGSVSAQERASVLLDRYNQILQLIATGDPDGCRKAQILSEEVPGFFGSQNLLGLCAGQKGNLTKAESCFRESVQLNPTFVPARNNLAVTLLQQGRVAEGASELETILSLEPDDVTARFNMGRVEMARGRPAQAVIHLERASLLAPEDAQISLTFSAALAASGKRTRAAEVARRVADREGTPAVVLAAGVLAFENGDAEAARWAFAKSLALASTSAELLFESARRAITEERFALAKALLETASGSLSNSAEWNAALGFAEFQLSEPERAYEYLRKALEISPRNEDYYMKMGQLLMAHRSDQAASAFFEAGLQRLPNSPRLHFGLAVCYLAGSRNWDEAHAHLEKSLQLDPAFEPALELLCQTAVFKKDWARLEKQATRLLEINSESFKGYYYRAMTWQSWDDQSQSPEFFEGSIAAFEKSLQINPEFVEARIELAKLLNKLEMSERAAQQLEIAVQIAPETEEAYFHLARAYRKLGKEEKSRQASREHARLNQVKRKETEKWHSLFQLKEQQTGEKQLSAP